MCLGVPMKIIEITQDLAIAESKGVRLPINIQLVEGAAGGDYVLVHAGFAIQKIDRDSARETLELLSSIDPGWRRY